MNILVKGNPLDFELESEENVLEVVETLEKWFLENNEVIEEIKIDGDPILPTQKNALESRLIQNTKQLEINTNSNIQYAVDSIFEVQDYIDKFISQLDNNIDLLVNDRQEDLLEGLKWINEVLLNICRILAIDINTVFYRETPLADIVTQQKAIYLELETYKYNPSVFKEILGGKLRLNLESFDIYLKTLYNTCVFQFTRPDEMDMSYVRESLNNIIETINSFIPKVPHIGTNLQAGKEIEAYLDIKNVLGMMESLVRHLQRVEEIYQLKYADLVIAEKNVDETNKEFNELLKDLSDAFTKSDIVLLGDLLEYELIPGLEVYKRIFQELIVLSEKKNYN
ncbi:MAG: hypothetical protein OEZ36_02900 [Spirochaetota bacterium]|nr:hypothetical protein [Spirochaetota bacterium]